MFDILPFGAPELRRDPIMQMNISGPDQSMQTRDYQGNEFMYMIAS